MLLAVVAAALVAGSGCSRDTPAPASPPFDPVAHAAAVDAWRAKHDTDYRRDWVSIAALHMLEPGDNTAGSAPGNAIVLPAPVPPKLGAFVLAKDVVRFVPLSSGALAKEDAPGLSPVAPAKGDARALLKGQPITGEVVLQEGEKSAGEITVGDVRLVVHVTGDRRAIRVRDPNGPLAKGFLGFTWFPIDPQYRVVGRFIRDAEPKSLKVSNTFGDEDAYTTEGVVEFTLLGQTLRLRPFTTRPKRFYIVFRDASAGVETYETARFLYADLLDDGTAVLDFNQAYNPPCAFNPYTTCPIPLKENRLPIKILAGERAYPATK